MRRLLMMSALVILPSFAHAENVVVLAVTCAITSAGPKVQGELRNNTDQNLDDVRVTGSFRNENGQFINEGDNRIEFNPLLPGQASPFSFFGDSNPAITNVTVVVSLDQKIIPFSGVTSADCR